MLYFQKIKYHKKKRMQNTNSKVGTSYKYLLSLKESESFIKSR